MENQQKDGWNEWSKHIIKELERLNGSTEKLREEIQKSNLEIAKLKSAEKEINELKHGLALIKGEIEKSSFKFESEVDRKIKSLIKDIDSNVFSIKDSSQSLIDRISVLENYKSYVIGIAVAVGVIISFIISVVALFDWGTLGGK